MRSFPRVFGAFSVLLFSSLSLQSQAATINVTEPTDAFGGAVCTLRNAIESTNNAGDVGGCVNSSPDGYGVNNTITLTAQTYILSLGGNDEDDNEFGDLDISTSVTITGAGTGTEISASGFLADQEDRVIHIIPQPVPVPAGGFTPSITVNFQDLTIRDGDTDSSGGGGGAGLSVDFFEALVTLTNVIVTENTVGGDGGGITNGGALLRIENSLINNNTASSDGGALNNNDEGIVIISNTTIDNNFAPDDGGGIQNFDTLLLVNSTVSNNTCVEDGNADIVISGGFSGNGGGIYNEGDMILVNSTISGNEAGFLGGGISDSTEMSTGDIDNLRVLILNSTIANNTVLDSTGFGGGICFSCEIIPQGRGSDFGLFNNLIAQNEAANSPDCGGDFFSGGFNLIGNDDNCLGLTATGDQVDVADAGIGPLQNNGGPTQTHALLEGSPAIDTANNVDGCQGVDIDASIAAQDLILIPLTEDQRAFTRPVAVLDPAVAICDIGSYEFQVVEPTPTPTPIPTPPVPPFTGLIEGSGCSLNAGASSSAPASFWMALGLAAVFYGLKKSQARS